MATFRLVATDLDGTLLRSDGSISDRTRSALRRAADANVRVTLVTARAPLWLQEIVDDLQLRSGYAVCSNGAIVYDFARGTPFLHNALPARVAARIVDNLRAAAPGVAFAAERESLSFREAHYEPLWPSEALLGDPLEFVSEPVSKLIVQHPQLSQAELFELVARVCGEDATATISGKVLVEISAAGITKAFALAALCEELNVEPESVLAFGDMPNDIPMLEWAGRGVAVENAHPDVIAVADEVTCSNDDDGVAAVLERMF